MRHNTFTWLITMLLGAAVFSQNEKSVEMSIRLAPNFSFSRVVNETSGLNAESAGATLKISAGLMADVYLSENIAISTGLWYSGKRAEVKYNGSSRDIDYNLQYLELPFLFKGFTNNISEKMRVYFQTGIVTGLCVGERYAEDDIPTGLPDEDFSGIIDFTWLIGAGVEMNVGTSNKAYFGIDYGHGLYNILNEDYLDKLSGNTVSINKFAVKNSYIALVAGFKF